MGVQVKRMALPFEKRGKSFLVTLPTSATIERAGIAPAVGEQSIWYTVRTDADENDVKEHKFVIIMDNETIDDDSGQHIGVWWEGNFTFHLYELWNS